jgi:hypothetical protein
MCGLVRGKFPVWVVVALAMCAKLPAQDGANIDAARAHEQRVIVLHDGGVVAGEVRHKGDRYVVKRDRFEMQIRAANVLLVAASLEDAYRKRQELLGQGSAAGHLQLADWCLRYDLLDHAAAELAAAERLEPHDGLLALLKRRLALAREQATNPPAEKAAPKSEPPARIEYLPAESGVGELPEGAVELFTRRVQPVLVNSCSTAGCHEAGGNQTFQLDRSLLHGMANRRSTMRNLSATLRLVDRDRPQRSPLLTVPRETHGGMERPVFGPRQEAALRHLVEWVVLVTKPPSDLTSEELRQPESVLPAAAEEVASNEGAESEVPRTLDSIEDGKEMAAAAPSGALELPPQRVRFGAQLKRWTPRDEFDPEIFNRQNARRVDEHP